MYLLFTAAMNLRAGSLDWPEAAAFWVIYYLVRLCSGLLLLFFVPALQRELSGYEEYVIEVPYRLVSGIW